MKVYEQTKFEVVNPTTIAFFFNLISKSDSYNCFSFIRLMINKALRFFPLILLFVLSCHGNGWFTKRYVFFYIPEGIKRCSVIFSHLFLFFLHWSYLINIWFLCNYMIIIYNSFILQMCFFFRLHYLLLQNDETKTKKYTVNWSTRVTFDKLFYI